jgi:DNA polymerase-3 subunit gamma/tau
MLNQDLAGAMLLYDDINKKGFEGDMVLNGFAEFIRNLLICKDDRIAGLLEVVDSFKKKYAETAAKTNAALLISSLNILNEAEIQFKSARNKRLHVELALIKLCYLSQAIELSAGASGLDKKKLTDSAKAVAFKVIQPIAVGKKPGTAPKPEATPVPSAAKLIIETKEEKPLSKPVIQESKTAIEERKPVLQEHKETYNEQPSGTPEKGKLSTLEAIRRKVTNDNKTKAVPDKALQLEDLKASWANFINVLKKAKNPAWQSFQDSELYVIDENSFEVVVYHNINQKFLELERAKASEFLQKELQNKQLQFSIILKEGEKQEVVEEVHLTAKQQYLKLVEEYPLVKELKERLRLELDY